MTAPAACRYPALDLSGPIPSIRPPFRADGAIDEAGLRRQVDYYVDSGFGALILTFGDSLLSLLTGEEIHTLTRIVVEQAAGRVTVVAADAGFATPQAVAFGRYCAEVGADVLMLMPPDWAASCSVDLLVEHFKAVGEHLPVMLVTSFFQQAGVFSARPMGFMVDTVERLAREVDALAAFKDDILGDLGRRLCLLGGSTGVRVISGGLMRNHIAQVPYGVNGYLCALGMLLPEVEFQYWKAIEEGRYPDAWKIINEIETPFWEIIAVRHASLGGFNAAVHGLMEYRGIGARHLRKPYAGLDSAAQDALRESLDAFLSQYSPQAS